MLEQILIKYFQPVGVHGEHDIKDALINYLKNHKRLQTTLYAVLLLLVLALFLISIWATIAWINDPQGYAILVGAIGVSVGGAMEMARRISREWNQSSLLLTLLPHATNNQIQDMLGSLTQSYAR
jgi:hypothetical protein